MSVYRASPNVPITYPDGNGAKATHIDMGGGPHQNPDRQPYRNRKRFESDFSGKFDEFEKKITSILTGMAQTQNEKLNLLSQNVSLIRHQIKDIKTTSDNLAVDQNNLKQELTTVKNFNYNIENKMRTLEDDVQQLKVSTDFYLTNFDYDELYAEVLERSARRNNVIITGLVETVSKNPEDRIYHDKNEVLRVLKIVDPDCPVPTKLIRLGKYEERKCRPVKVTFASAETAKMILRKRRSLVDSGAVKIYFDETPHQKSVMINLRDELRRRTHDGEKDLTIKFIKGVPKIVDKKQKF